MAGAGAVDNVSGSWLAVVLSILLNLIWFVCGGLVMGLGW